MQQPQRQAQQQQQQGLLMTPKEVVALQRHHERLYEEQLKLKVYDNRDRIKQLHTAYEVSLMHVLSIVAGIITLFSYPLHSHFATASVFYACMLVS